MSEKLKTRREAIISKKGNGFEVGSFDDGISIHYETRSLVNKDKPTVIISCGHKFWPLTVDNNKGFHDFWLDVLESASENDCVIITEMERKVT